MIEGPSQKRPEMSRIYTLCFAFLASLAACDQEDGSPEPAVDAGVSSLDAGLPACADVGCPEAALCNAAGICTCRASGEPVACAM
jgi:hypothetical protein